MKDETIRALALLYGSTEEPVCAVGEDLSLLWCKDGRAAELVMLLGAELGGADSGKTLLLPPDDSYLLRTAVPPVRVQIQQLSEDGTPYYLLRFLPCPLHRSLDPAEIRALLAAKASADSQSILSLLQYGRKMQKSVRPESAEAGLIGSLVLEPCYAMLNRSARINELVWYERLRSEKPAALFAAADLSAVVTQFAAELGEAAKEAVQITADDLEPGLSVLAEPRRLHFAMLLLFLQMQEQIAGASVLTVRTERTESDGACLTMHLSAADAPPAREIPFRTRVIRDGTLLADDALLERFCAAFGTSYTLGKQKNGCIARLIFPPFTGDAPYLELHASVLRYAGSRNSLAHVLLSELISARFF